MQESGGEIRVTRRRDSSFTAWHKTIITCVAIVVVGTTATLVASAAIPSGNTYHACANKKSGVLRVIDPAKKQKCNKATEQALSWGKQGPQGAPGAAGAAGPSHGALIYQSNYGLIGPYTEGQQVATFTVPAGLMCVTASATAFQNSHSPSPYGLELTFDGGGDAPDIDLYTATTEGISHHTLITREVCASVVAGTYHYIGYKNSGLTATDGVDSGYLHVEVFSP